MAFVTPTDPQAAKVEAEELRKQAAALLEQANQLDPPAVEEPETDEVEKPKAKKGKK